MVDTNEGHDPKNAEAKSIASVKAAEKTGKSKAPARKGDKTAQEPMVKTKAEIVQAAYMKMAGMAKEDLEDALGDFIGDDDWDVESVDVSEELQALVDSEATLSEEFKEKTAVLFESALASRLTEEVARLEESFNTELSEAVEGIQSDLVDKVDSFLNYVVESWMKENELAIQNGLRTEIAEDFMTGLKTLFEESYITVPDDRVDLVDGLAARNEELEESINATLEENISLYETVTLLVRDNILQESSRDLATTQAEKLASLCEGLDFEDEDSFANKVKIIKEAHFNKLAPSTPLEEDAVDSETDVKAVSSMMEQYVNAVSKTK